MMEFRNKMILWTPSHPPIEEGIIDGGKKDEMTQAI